MSSVPKTANLGPQLQATTKFDPDKLPLLPPEVINEYIEQGRNPDVYTREFVERVQRDNAYHKAKYNALADFRDALADEMVKGFGKEIEPYVQKALSKSRNPGEDVKIGEVGIAYATGKSADTIGQSTAKNGT